MKLPNPRDLRDTLLARRWTQAELVKLGLVDEVVDDIREKSALVRRAVEIGIKEGPLVGPGSWGTIKVCCAVQSATSPNQEQEGIYHGVQDASRSHRPVRFPVQEAEAFWARGKHKGDAAKANL